MSERLWSRRPVDYSVFGNEDDSSDSEDDFEPPKKVVKKAAAKEKPPTKPNPKKTNQTAKKRAYNIQDSDSDVEFVDNRGPSVSSPSTGPSKPAPVVSGNVDATFPFLWNVSSPIVSTRPAQPRVIPAVESVEKPTNVVKVREKLQAARVPAKKEVVVKLRKLSSNTLSRTSVQKEPEAESPKELVVSESPKPAKKLESPILATIQPSTFVSEVSLVKPEKVVNIEPVVKASGTNSVEQFTIGGDLVQSRTAKSSPKISSPKLPVPDTSRRWTDSTTVTTEASVMSTPSPQTGPSAKWSYETPKSAPTEGLKQKWTPPGPIGTQRLEFQGSASVKSVVRAGLSRTYKLKPLHSNVTPQRN